jgi:hypothetical protein
MLHLSFESFRSLRHCLGFCLDATIFFHVKKGMGEKHDWVLCYVTEYCAEEQCNDAISHILHTLTASFL